MNAASRTLLELTAIFDNASVGILFTRDRVIQRCNRRTAEMFGYRAPEALIGQPAIVLYPDAQSYEQIGREAGPLLAAGQSFHTDWLFRKADGSTIWINLYGKAVDPAHTEQGTVWILEDITEAKQTEAALHQTMRQLEAIMKNAPVAIYFTHDRRLIRYNKRCAEMFAIEGDRGIGEPTRRFFRSDEEYAQLGHIAGPRLSQGKPFQTEMYLRRMDGTDFWVNLIGYVQNLEDTREGTIWIAEDRSAFKQAEEALKRSRDELERRVQERTAELAGVVDNLNAEISERKLAEEALRESEQRYRTLVEHAPEAIVVLDVETGRFVDANDNAGRLFGLPKAALLAAGPLDVSPPTQPDGQPSTTAARAAIQDAVAGGTPVFEWTFHNAAGTDIPCELRLVRLPASGRVLVRASITDISERKRLEAQLQQSQKMEAVGRLAGGIAHDFNNILTAILGYADLMLGELDPASSLRQEIQAIRTAGQRAAALTRQLLAFSRQQVLQPELVNLNTVVTNLSHMLRRLIGEDIELVAIPGPELGLVKADPSQLEQVILNLAVNARDAMPAGGKLTIETANVELDAAYAREHVGVRPGAYVLLAISDTGHGMDAATQARIFEPFFTTKEVGRGTGLGLAMVHGIVNQSGGHIWVYSEVGHDTTFKIYLPQAAEHDIIVRARPALIPAPHGSETILLIEDDALVRALVHEVLQTHGYTVLTASTGLEALQLAQAYPGSLDLVLSDVILPGGLSGPQVAQQLATQRPTVKVLYMSGYTDQAIVHHRVLEAGLAFLQKPFTPETLVRKVREVLDTPAALQPGEREE